MRSIAIVDKNLWRSTMERYVDGFVIPLPMDKVDDYKRIADNAGVIWKEHGALEYWECLGTTSTSRTWPDGGRGNEMNTASEREFEGVPAHLRALLRHFADLRDGTHGDGAVSRADKERLFSAAVDFLAPYVRQALGEMNEALLSATGTIAGGAIIRSAAGDVTATWTLSWPEQSRAGIPPITLEAFFGHGFHHPHLRGATVGVWPLNVFSTADAAAELPTLRAIAAADLHNLVFQRDYRIVPAITGS